MAAWGFTYKALLTWHKVRADGGSDGRGVGFYFRNVTEHDPVWRSRQECPDARTGASAGELSRARKARTFKKTG